MLCGIATKPAAGVMATNPTTAPTQKPTTEGFLPLIISKNIQDSPAAAAAVLVVEKADTESVLAPRADPALKPNQPNHNKPVPIKTYGILAGMFSLFSICTFLGFNTIAPAKA